MLRKYRAVFTSRWKALIWAAGVCLTAYCTVPREDPATRAPQPAAAHPSHVNPWAIQRK